MILNENIKNDIVLKIKNLTKKYNNKIIIQNLSLEVKKEEKVIVFAQSGAGKTTLIRIIAKLEKATKGIIIRNYKRFSLVFQEPRLFPYKTIYENIVYPLKIQNIKIDNNIFNKWIEITNLSDSLSKYPYQISGGMKQKVALIRGFLINPDFIILDEPFKSIDIVSKFNIARFICKNYSKTTIIFVTHSVDEIKLIGKKLYLFSEIPLSRYKEITVDKNFSEEYFIKSILFNSK